MEQFSYSLKEDFNLPDAKKKKTVKPVRLVKSF